MPVNLDVRCALSGGHLAPFRNGRFWPNRDVQSDKRCQVKSGRPRIQISEPEMMWISPQAMWYTQPCSRSRPAFPNSRVQRLLAEQPRVRDILADQLLDK